MNDNIPKRPLRVGLISLGCAKNLADAEIMLGRLLQDGVEVTNDATTADVVIVNTCSFIDSAQEESVDAILESDELRQANNRGQGLIVSGCLPQRFRDELPKLLPEVDAFMGIDQVNNATEIVKLASARRQEKLASRAKLQTPNSKSQKSSKLQFPKSLGKPEPSAGSLSPITEHGTRNTEHESRVTQTNPPRHSTPDTRLHPSPTA